MSSTSAATGTRVAGVAWQLQKLGPPGKAEAGAFTSPFSLYIALALALRGAGSSSEQELYHLLHQDKFRLLGLMQPKDATADDVQQLLQQASALSGSLNAQAGNGCEVVVASSIWTKQWPITQEYAAAAKQLFQAEAQQVESVDAINAWAERVTKGLIKTAVPPGTPFDMVLTNAVYFKGLWELSFNKDNTSPAPFALEGGSKVEVQMMRKSFKNTDRTGSPDRVVKYVESAAYKAVRLPYKGCSISAIAVLPSEQAVQKHGFAAAIAELDVDELLDASKYRKVSPMGLELEMPRFTVKNECMSLSSHLKQLGVTSSFDRTKADFSKLSPQPLYISDVLQSVCVIVDEEGTEAAAVTSVVMMRCMAVMAEPPSIKLDRPFLFMLVDDASSTPLFVGSVLDPSK